MKKDKSIYAVVISTLYLLIYIVLLASESTVRYAVLMFSLSPFLLIVVVFYILKYGKASKKTFDEYFYDDIDL